MSLLRMDLKNIELVRFGDAIRIKRARANCGRCGILVTDKPIAVVRSRGRWVCQDTGPCRWRRERALLARQTTFDWG